MKNASVWNSYSPERRAACDAFCREYMDFLSNGKTERECTDLIVADAERAGYRNLDDVVETGMKLGPGSRVYRVNKGKGVLLYNIGTDPVEQGMNILGAHIDSPRLDVKQNPLYEDGGFALLDTHYYGGIKKYQWVTVPLAIHGVVVRKDGTSVRISIGEDPDDPVVFVSDLLIHLAQEQLARKGATVVEGEALDVIVGNRPISEEDTKKEKAAACESAPEAGAEGDEAADRPAKDAVKREVLRLLKEKYEICEQDFLSAELEIVPAGRAREAGLDRSMILSYGQDDRVCAFTSYRAMLNVPDVKRTACCILVDKEEIGSVGATGMQSRFFENTTAEVLARLGTESELSLRRCLASSSMLSSDVSSAFDPLYAGSFDKKNVAYLGRGMVFNKFTGARGKSGSNDADAEYLGYLRGRFAEEDVKFQTAELGKVDHGGGGTIAYIMALYGMDVVDSGVAVLSMHSPHEATSKADVYETKRGYEAFLRGGGRK